MAGAVVGNSVRVIGGEGKEPSPGIRGTGKEGTDRVEGGPALIYILAGKEGTERLIKMAGTTRDLNFHRSRLVNSFSSDSTVSSCINHFGIMIRF